MTISLELVFSIIAAIGGITATIFTILNRQVLKAQLAKQAELLIEVQKQEVPPFDVDDLTETLKTEQTRLKESIDRKLGLQLKELPDLVRQEFAEKEQLIASLAEDMVASYDLVKNYTYDILSKMDEPYKKGVLLEKISEVIEIMETANQNGGLPQIVQKLKLMVGTMKSTAIQVIEHFESRTLAQKPVKEA